MPDTPLGEWQARFFEQRVLQPVSGPEGVYFREQVFGALAVLEEALPDVLESLGEPNFRFFVRELLATTQPNDALGTTLIPRFLELLETHPKLSL
jgi:hypothetical protein